MILIPGMVRSASRRRSRDTRSVNSKTSGTLNCAHGLWVSGCSRPATASMIWRALATSGSISVKENGAVASAMASTSDHASRSRTFQAREGSARSPSATRASALARRRTSRASGHASRPSAAAAIAHTHT